jgi:hypothetical protein
LHAFFGESPLQAFRFINRSPKTGQAQRQQIIAQPKLDNSAQLPGLRTRANVDGTITKLLPGILSVWSAERCAEFIRARARESTPWFAQYCPTIPHSPYTPSEDSEHLYDGVKRRVSSVNERDNVRQT